MELTGVLKDFLKVTNEQAELITSLWNREITINRGERIITSNTKEQYIYFIKSGTCRIVHPDKEEDKILGFGYPGTFLFSPSILNNKVNEQDVFAIKKMSLVGIHKSDFFNFIYTDNRLTKIWAEQLGELLISQIDRQVDLLISSPKERYDRLLKRSPQVLQFIPQKYIASYLRMSPETLSRIQNS